MLLLHLFEYPHARAEFIAAQEIEPDFAMAYWGEAMTHNHPIWDEQDLAAAREVLVKLGATTEQRQAVSEDRSAFNFWNGCSNGCSVRAG